MNAQRDTAHGDRKNILRYVWLSLLPGFGVVSQNKLVRMCKSIENCFLEDADELLYRDSLSNAKERIGKKRLEVFIRSREKQEEENRARSVIEECKHKHISIITVDDPEYPHRFKGLPDMPCVLYVRGNLRVNDYKRTSGVVGARRCSENGKQSAIMITNSEVKKGAAIISGMAKGIDSYAHTAALKKEGYTIAVLGNGVDICYPEEHERLYEEIVRKGCALSEYPPGTKPREYSFPKRNRLIAALSDGLFVIDVGRHSGTETTAKACELYGRTVTRISLEINSQPFS